jgi:hypothetical protein
MGHPASWQNGKTNQSHFTEEASHERLSGCPAGIVTPVPHMRELARGETKALLEKAKFRLKVFD